MNAFNWGCPTHFRFGQGAASEVGAVLAAHGARKALVVSGGSSAERSGLLATVRESLESCGIAYVELKGVRPNPEVSLVRAGIELARSEGVDYLVAVGGGSVIDCTKAISFGVYHDGDVWDFFEKRASIEQTLPIAAILTIPAAGSESSSSCVISNDALGLKRGVNSELFRPKVAFLDPALTCTLPPYQTAAGATDMIAHICERWFSGVGAVPVTDATAAGLIRTIMDQTPRALADPTDLDARANLMWAGTLAHNGIAGLGRALNPDGRAGGWESHALEHELSALRPEVTHGAGLAVMLPAWMRYVWRADPQRFCAFGMAVFDIEPVDENDADIEAAVLQTIDALADFFTRIGMPRTLGEFGIDASDIPVLLAHLEHNKGATFGAFRKLDMDDARAIYLSAL